MTTITPAELARRARANAMVRLTPGEAAEYLAEWREAGIAREVRPGEWALTRSGRAMFGGWSLGLDRDDDEAGA